VGGLDPEAPSLLCYWHDLANVNIAGIMVRLQSKGFLYIFDEWSNRWTYCQRP